MSGKKSVMFLCTGNSCRSQMAEGCARHFWGEKLNVYSAGIENHGLNPNAVAVMQEAGIDITSQTSNTVEELPTQKFDLVITVCGHADENCPAFGGDTKVVHVGFDDPPKLAKEAANEEEAALDCYRRVCGEIKAFVADWPNSLPDGSGDLL